MADPGLIWFEVAVPGRGKSEICRLPEPLWPKAIRRKALVVLRPGEVFSRRFDPRFFCFAELEQKLLVPGAKVTPHFGWPEDTQVVWNGGKRRVQTLPTRAPFVAWALPAEPAPPEEPAEAAAPATKQGEQGEQGEQGNEPEPGRAEDETSADAEAQAPPPRPFTPLEGLKLLDGATLTLTSAYGAWSEPEPRSKLHELALLMLGGSDAEDERSVTATVGVYNGAPVTHQIFLRRELFEYDVVGPEGRFSCESSEVGSPDFASFTTLAPGKAEAMVVRLIEVCPRGAFARAGLYEVRARLHAKWSGQGLGLDAFIGLLETHRPTLVRVRSGDRSAFFRSTGPMVAGDGAADAPNAPGGAGLELEAPADGTQEAPLPGEAPADHEPPAGVEELPPPEAPAPPEGTNVE
jgi:hypothetical protein